MSLELGQPADGDQATTADEAEETRGQEGTTVPAQPATSDATTAYADSGVPDHPDDSDVAEAPGPEEPDAYESSRASQDPDEDEPDETDVPGTPVTAGAYGASDAEPAADLDAPDTTGSSVLDDATDAPGAAYGTTDATDPADAPLAPADEEDVPVSASGAPAASGAQLEEAAGDLDGPLLGDAAGLRTDWQQILAGFVDDPRVAVADAAGLVDRTAQALVGALQARQRLLRAMWDSDASPDDLGASAIGSPTGAHAAGASRADDTVDTEELRLLIQRYRTLFNDICRP